MDVGTEFVGELRFRDTFRIDGRREGQGAVGEHLDRGRVRQRRREIDCGIVSIRGTVKGKILGRQRIELLAGCKVHGTLVSPRVVIEEGAFFEGNCDMSAASKRAVIALPLPARAAASPES
jgi:cytoskeletal protein CcmA (bactofilin family)